MLEVITQIHPKVVVRTLKLAYAGFVKNDVQRMSAALAYHTIFSITPLLVIAVAIVAL